MPSVWLTLPFLGVAALLSGVGGYFGGWIGAAGGAAIAFVVNLIVGACLFSLRRIQDRYDLRAPAGPRETEFANAVSQMATAARWPQPKVWIIDSVHPNALATGFSRNSFSVVVTSALLEQLPSPELHAVAAYLVARLKRRDTTIHALITAALGGLTETAGNLGALGDLGLAGLIFFLGAMVVVALWLFLASLVEMAIFRWRQYRTDRMAAALCGGPRWLIAALERVETHAAASDWPVPKHGEYLSQLFFVNPRAQRRWLSNQPRTADRVARLRRLWTQPLSVEA
jgi:heat shock protein HtpX